MTQRTTAYYDRTADQFDSVHGNDVEHDRAILWFAPLLRDLRVQSILDVGCGTGRALGLLRGIIPAATLRGMDPSAKLLDVARRKVTGAEFTVGAGEHIALPDRSVDLVVATGIMHHVDRPREVIQNMLRVARLGILVSDHNNFAFGGRTARQVRLLLYATGLLPAFQYVKQGFKRQGYSEGDGWWYPYSLAGSYGTIASETARVYMVGTRPADTKGLDNLLLAQSHFALLALKHAPGPNDQPHDAAEPRCCLRGEPR